VQRRSIVVAIDGPSGSGKSTVARGTAQALGLRYLDTGAMYRAITWLALRDGLPLDDPAALTALAETAQLEVITDPTDPGIRAQGIDVASAVRTPEVTAAVSAVSAVAGVRTAMVSRQQAIIGDGGIVVEGRDIGTTVAPQAAVKVFLTADAATRAARRADQDGLGTAGRAGTEADLNRRDSADSGRVASPLTQPPDALEIDSSSMSAQDVVERIVAAAGPVSA
jgi:cytidylate kinase